VHQRLEREIAANTGKSLSQAMTDAGYSPGYAKNPQDLKKTKKWQKLIKKYLPENTLVQKHKQLLNIKWRKKIFANTVQVRLKMQRL
jgi:GTP-binding protein EngB required for normal cell division